jgi:hypothetical protein
MATDQFIGKKISEIVPAAAANVVLAIPAHGHHSREE